MGVNHINNEIFTPLKIKTMTNKHTFKNFIKNVKLFFTSIPLGGASNFYYL